MKKIECIAKFPIRQDGKLFKIGEPVFLSESDYKRKLARGLVEAAAVDAEAEQKPFPSVGELANKAKAEKEAADKLEADRVAAEKEAADKLEADRVAAEKKAADKLEDDRKAAEKAAGKKAEGKKPAPAVSGKKKKV